MTDEPPQLWTPRSVEETQKVYADWAANYDKDVGEWGYATPVRVAVALRQVGARPDKPILDFGCGTGLSGMALKTVGFDVIDGTDISPEMLEKAEERACYRQVWVGEPGSMGHVKRGQYPVISACGVVSMGAAPPETLHMLIDAVPSGGHLAFSYNDATLEAREYTDALDVAVLDPEIELVFEEHGPHLPAKDMKSTVYVLTRK